MLLCEVTFMHRLLKEGLSISEIARRLGRSRQTIYNWLQAETNPSSPSPRAGKLDSHHAYIRSRLEFYDLPATVLLRELRKRGYKGGITILKDFIRPIKMAHVQRIVDRFETKPGRQAQMDWSPCGYIWHQGRRRKLSLFALVLGYSRMIWARFVVSERRPVLMECLEKAFRELGGIPWELLIDNMKSAVAIARTKNHPAVLQPAFLDFSEHWGFETLACPPYWPRTKGKIERGIGYIKKSFLEGLSFTDLEDLNSQLRIWLAEVANIRIHGTTKERPIDRFPVDLAAMQPFKARAPYPALIRVTRRADHDGRISFQGVRYSIDPEILNSRRGILVTVQVSAEEEIRIYHEDRLVGVHAKKPAGSPPQDDPRHALARRRLRQQPAWKRPQGKTPAFAQTSGPETQGGLPEPPVVQERALETYEGRA